MNKSNQSTIFQICNSKLKKNIIWTIILGFFTKNCIFGHCPDVSLSKCLTVQMSHCPVVMSPSADNVRGQLSGQLSRQQVVGQLWTFWDNLKAIFFKILAIFFKVLAVFLKFNHFFKILAIFFKVLAVFFKFWPIFLNFGHFSKFLPFF